MKKISFFLLMLAAFCLNTNATKYRVNNKAGSGAHYSELQTANNDAAVLAGDTLLIEGSTVRYNDVTFTKKLVIIGPGYFLAQNAETQANLADGWIDDVQFDPGSDSSVIMGMNIDASGYDLGIAANAVIVKRCYISSDINISANDVMLLQNYISFSGNCISFDDGYSNLIIQNNFINSNDYTSIDINGSSTAIISNNLIYNGHMSLRNSTVSNNIWRLGTFYEDVNNTYLNNICNGTQFPAGSNMQNVDMGTVFVGTGSDDGQWQLSGTSPALGYGVDGVDCGIFGGVDPYVLSGMPPIPSIYFFSAPTTASDSLAVTIKIKSHK